MIVNQLNPTHHCFDDALDLLIELVKEDPSQVDRLQLVHAICVAPGDGRPFAHAWVEDGAVCWDAGLLPNGQRVYYAVPQAEYLAAFAPVHMTRYSVPAALAANRRAGHFGPWLPLYRALCNQGGPAVVFGSIAAAVVFGSIAAKHDPPS